MDSCDIISPLRIDSLKIFKYILKPEIHCFMHQMSLFLHASKTGQQILAVKKTNLFLFLSLYPTEICKCVNQGKTKDVHSGTMHNI